MSKRFTLTLLEDDFGDAYISIPEEVAEALDWNIDDVLQYTLEEPKLTFEKSNELSLIHI